MPGIGGGKGARVEARGLTRRYGAQVALGSFTATFEPGRLTVVTGPSGSGKSTLLSLLAGLDVPDEGEVVIGGVTVSALDRDGRAAFRRDHIAFVGQSPGLSGFLSARENVELGLAVRGIDSVQAHERSGDALAVVGLVEHADRKVALLSAGQRERVAIARALAVRPSVILADEPTARIDVAGTLALGGLFADIAIEYGTTFVCATHDQLLIGLADDQVELVAPARVP